MYPLEPVGVFALTNVRRDPQCVRRMDRMLAALRSRPEIRWFDEDELPQVMTELATLWPPAEAPAGAALSFKRPLVFTAMHLGGRRPDLSPLVERCGDSATAKEVSVALGHMTTAIDQHPHERDRRDNFVCWPTYNLGTVYGCSHGCSYCPTGRAGRFLAIALNLEEYMREVVEPVIEANPWNRVFRMILDGADLMTLEPEYGLFDLFVQTLARHPGRFGHFHTASSNVDWLSDLPHRDLLVGVWSLACDTIAREIETGTGHAGDRVEAAARCQAMGIPVRFKFKPVIPVRNWRAEYASIIEKALTETDPESMGFCLYMWNSYESMESMLPLDILDPECVEAARRSVDEMRGVLTGPFPHETRKTIYRHLIREVRRWTSDLPIFLCTESREMWDDLKEEVGQDPGAYVCACSSVAVPGGGLALSKAFRYSTYHPTPL